MIKDRVRKDEDENFVMSPDPIHMRDVRGKVVAIVCMNQIKAIGKNNDLMYELPEDLKQFKSKTVGNNIIMGYNTWKSLPTKPLKNRFNAIVATKPCDIEESENVKVFESVPEAIEYCKRDNKLLYNSTTYIIGGGRIYEEAMPYIDAIDATIVDDDAEGDVYFPHIDLNEFTASYTRYPIKDGKYMTDGVIFKRKTSYE